MKARFVVLIAAVTGSVTLGVSAAPIWAAADETPESIPATQTYPRLGSLGGIAQTPDGYMWFGSRQGLQRFDGVDIKLYTSAEVPALQGGGVHNVLASSDGGLWLASGDGVLGFGTGNMRPLVSDRRGMGALVHMSANATTFTKVGLRGDNGDVWIWAMAQDDDGILWLGTDHGLAQVMPSVPGQVQGIRMVPCANALHDATIAAVTLDQQTQWLGTDRGVFVRRAGVCEATDLSEPTSSLARSSDGHIFAGTHSGLVELINGKIHRRFTHSDGLPSDDVYALLSEKSDRLWVGTGSSVLLLDRGAGSSLSLQSLGQALTLFKDREDSIWFNTSVEGAVQIRNTFVAGLGRAEGLAADTTFAVMKARDGSIWTSTVAGLSHVASKTITNYAYGSDLPVWSIRSLAEGADGTVWMTAGNEGLVSLTNGIFTRLPNKEVESPQVVSTVASSHDGALWVGRGDGSIVRFASGSPVEPARVYTTTQGACPGRTLTAIEDADGTMWWGTSNGLTRISELDVKCLSTRTGLPVNDITSLHLDSNGSLWLGSRSDVGLMLLSDGVARVLGTAQGLPAGGTFGIADDGAGHLWWSSAQGLHRALRSEVIAVLDGKKERVATLSLGLDDGLRTAEMMSAFHPAVAVTNDGRVWFPSSKGLAVVKDPDRIDLLPLPTPLVQSTLNAGRESPATSALHTEVGATSVEFRYTAPSFLLPHRLQFQYRLDGVDSEWVDAGNRRAAHYANLAPGHYRFRVRLADKSALVHKEASMAVVVPPQYFQTWWFRLLAGAGIVGLIASAYRRRVRVMHERSLAIHSERGRIARDLHDHLGQNLGALGFLTDALCLNGEPLPNQTRDLVAKLKAVVAHTKQGVNDLIWDLRAVSESMTLQAALLDVVERSKSLGADVSVNVSPKSLLATPLQINEIPFIVQEAITNAVQHGQAKHVVIEVVRGLSSLEVRVADDGHWAKSNAEHEGGGYGLVGMQERARRLKGKLVVGPNHATGRGTVVRLTIPFV